MSISRQLRIIAIPLTRPNVVRTLKTKPSRLVYFQFKTAINSIRLASGDQDSDPTNPEKKGRLAPVAEWVVHKFSDIWARFGKEDRGWKVSSVYWQKAKMDGFLVLAESRKVDAGPSRS
jgi:hypothetical protein